MTKRTRTVLFIITTCMFLMAAPAVLLYSQGWRFDFKTWQVVKVGAFYFRVYPKRTSILIEGKKYRTDYFFGSLFVEGFLPGKYQVRIEKGGFLPWEKSLKIEEKTTTKTENVFLVPEKTEFNILAKEVGSIIPFLEQQEIVFVSKNEGWELKVLDLKANLLVHLLSEKDVEEGALLQEISFVPKNNKLFLKIKTKEGEKYFTLDVTTAFLAPIELSSLKEDGEEKYPTPPENIAFSEDGKKIFFIQKVPLENGSGQPEELFKNWLFEADLGGKPTPLLENIVSYTTKESSIYFLDEFGFLFETDLRGQRKQKVNQEAFELKEALYKIYAFPPFVFLQEDESLYLINKEGSFEKVFDNLKGIKASPGNEKVVFFSEHEIWLFFLDNVEKQPPKEQGERVFLSRLSGSVNSVFWYTEDYLILNVGQEIKICETDERDRIQIWDLKGIEGDDIFWNIENKSLYFLKEKNLFVTERLIK